MNEEGLRVIDMENENGDIKKIEESNFVELPVHKKEIIDKSKDKMKVIDKLPSWSIEPPIEINRGGRWVTKNGL